MAGIRDEVRTAVLHRFPAEVQPQVLRALSQMSDPPDSSPDWSRARARVHLGIIKLSGGDLGRLLANVAQAQIDWRDTLYAAGLENDDWPRVLQAAGYDVPE